ncbi:unnamed protein product [Ectocarpus fasciculatus]
MQECRSLAPLGSLQGKVVVVTGGNSGLGFETSKSLAAAGATVVMGCRSADRGQRAREEILRAHPAAAVAVLPLDLASFKSIRRFADEFSQQYGRLDVLVNNAGIMALAERELTEDGLEAQVGTNHVGHFLLTALLFPLLARNARDINHSSEMHRSMANSFPGEDMQAIDSYSPWGTYGNSKGANLLFTYELNHRLEAAGNPRNIISVAVHPGYSSTNLQLGRFPMARQINALFAMPAADGALAQVVAAGGEGITKSDNTYFGPKYAFFGAPAVVATDSKTWNRERQQLLWEESLRLIGAHKCFITA